MPPAHPPKLALLALPALLASGCSAVRYTDSFYPDPEVQGVVLQVDQGTVELVVGERLRVERSVRASPSALELSHRIEGGLLVLEARCRNLVPCVVDTRVEVPDGLPVTVELGEGEVWATALTQLELELGEGRADLDVRERLVASVGTGHLRGRLGEAAQGRITVASGDVEIQVPSGPWALDLTVEHLEIQDVQPDEAAAGRLQVIAPAGQLRLWGEGPVANR